MKPFWKLAAVSCLILSAPMTWAQEEEEEPGPGGTLESQFNHTSTSNEAYFGSPQISTGEYSPAGGSVFSTSPALEITPDLVRLAEGLNNDPVKIYNYVRNEIESELYFGLKKGPRMTLLEQAGNDLDKAFLLKALLTHANLMTGGAGVVEIAHGLQTLPYHVGDGVTPDICSLWNLDPNAMNADTGANPVNFFPTTPPTDQAGVKNWYQTNTPYLEVSFPGSDMSNVAWRRVALAFRHALNNGYWNVSRMPVPTSSSGVTIRRFYVKISGFPGMSGPLLLDPWLVRYNRLQKKNLSILALPQPDDLVVGGQVHSNTLWRPTSQSQRDWHQQFLVPELKERAEDLREVLKSGDHFAKTTCDEIFGSRELVKDFATSLQDAAVASSTEASSNGVSRLLAWRLNLKLGDEVEDELYLPSLAGRRISVTVDPESTTNQQKMSLGVEKALFGADFENFEIAEKNIGTAFSTTLASKILMPFRELTESPSVVAALGPIPSASANYDRNAETAQHLKAVHSVIYGFSPSGGFLRSRQARLDEILQVAEANYPGSTTGSTIDWAKIPVTVNGLHLLLRQQIMLETLNVKGLDWLYQTNLLRQRAGDVFGANLGKTVSLGRMSQNGGYFIDIYHQLSASTSRYGNYNEPGGEIAGLYSAMLLESALEHSVIEQANAAVQIYSGNVWRAMGASTVNILHIGNSGAVYGMPVFGVVVREKGATAYLNNPPWEQVRPNVGTSYGLENEYGGFDAFFGLHAPLDSKSWAPPPVALSTYKGHSKFQVSPTGLAQPVSFSGGAFLSPSTIQMKVGSSLGGYSVLGDLMETSFIQESDYSKPSYFDWSSSVQPIEESVPSYEKLTSYGADPVNVANGSFEHAEVDLVLGSGEAPTGLSFKRDYTSSRARHDLSAMGFGWTHNWDIRLVEHTNAAAGMGATLPRYSAAFVVGLEKMKEYLKPPKYGTGFHGHDNETIHPKRWMVVNGIAKWCVDQITNNAITVTMGNEAETFIRNPDGTFDAGAGSQMSLTMVSPGVATVQQRHGNTMEFSNLYSGTHGYRRGRATKITGPHGQIVNLTWGANGISEVSSVAGTKTRKLVFGYGSTGSKHLESVTESVGGTTTRVVNFTYSGGRLVTATDPENGSPAQSSMSGGSTAYVYSSPLLGTVPSCLSSIIDPMGREVVRNFYDEFCRVRSQDSGSIEEDSQGNLLKPWKFLYAGVSTDEVDPLGGTKSYYFDKTGRLYRQDDALGNASVCKYDAEDRVVETIDPRGAKVVTTYDLWNNPLTVSEYRNAGSVAPYVTTNTYYAYPDLRPWTTTDPLNRTTTFTYPAGSIAADPLTVDKEGQVITNAYITTGFAKGKLQTVTDADGIAVTYAYDSEGNLTSESRPGGDATQYLLYTPLGDPTSVVDPENRVDYYAYNKRRQAISHTRTDPANSSYTLSETKLHDAAGRLALEKTATGRSGGFNTKAYEYLSSGKPTYIRHAGGDGTLWSSDDTFEQKIYDEREWVVQERDVAGNITNISYHANGLESVTTLPQDPKLGSRTTATQYDVSGRPTVATDVLGRNTGTAYAEQVSESLPHGGGTTFTGDRVTITDVATGKTIKRTEDAAGNERVVEDRNNQRYRTDYDDWDRPTKVTTPGERYTENAYMADGRLSQVKKGKGSGTSSVLSRVHHATTRRLTSLWWQSTGRMISYTYNNKGHVLNSTEASKTATRTYDGFDRVRTYKNADGWMIGYEYYNDGMLKRIYYPDSATDTNPFDNDSVLYDYDQQGRLKTITDWANRVTTYTWRPDGRLVSITRPNGTIRTINYDTLARVVGFTERTSGGDLILVQRLDYRKSDDLASSFSHPRPPVSGQTPPVAMTSATYGIDNQMVSLISQGVTTPVSTDDRGNTTGALLDGSGLAASLTYDELDRLTAVNAGAPTSYAYDPDGNRRTMTHGGATTNYVFDPYGGSLVRMLVRIDSTGKKTRYVYGVGLDYEVDQTTGQAKFYHYDFSGNTAAITGSTGVVTDRYHYSPYGQVVYSTGSTVTPFKFGGFMGVITDPNGLLSMRARFYSPVLCRFLSMDPAQFEGGMNWYAYASGNPMTLGDPTGFGSESTLDAIQTGLSMLGMMPVVGFAFDLVNAGVSLARGNYADAAMNMVSAIPGIGDAIGVAKIAAVGGATLGVGKLMYNAGFRVNTGALYSGIPMLHRVASKAAPVVEQYALRAADSGFYPVMTRGFFKNPTGLVWLEKGDVWKFGTTKNPSTRYSQTFLDNTGDHGLIYSREWSGTLTEALQLEGMKIRNYLLQSGGVLPAGNKVIR